ncbi:MAG: hypothetical protein VX737_03830 [Pseudomonadota bacterium]|nr:hypothetical protein [Pseudomonadota bacterium]
MPIWNKSHMIELGSGQKSLKTVQVYIINGEKDILNSINSAHKRES